MNVDEEEQWKVFDFVEDSFWKNWKSVTISMTSTVTICICLTTINRKTVKGKYTDMAWYLQNIIYKFLDIDVRLLSYKIEEYED